MRDSLQTGFSARVIAWQARHGRHDLPWQGTRDAYRIWVSEIMLQQTQVSAVIPYYERFLARFPDIASLARASLDDVLRLWSGLGYYSRARNLHRCAQEVVAHHDGRFPEDAAAIAMLPGIGRSTAAAISAFAHGGRAPILDGNVKRVFCRHFGVEGYPGDRGVETRLWTLAEEALPLADIEGYTQGLMDLGATVCTRSRPRCEACPVAETCEARRTDRTAVLPAPKPRKALPHRETAVLVLVRGADVLLEKRPTPGIWAGLWSLPECPTDAVSGRLAAVYGLGGIPAERQAPIEHAFTHYRLTLHPFLARWPARRRAPEPPPGHSWTPLASLAGAALPAPIKRFLQHLAG